MKLFRDKEGKFIGKKVIAIKAIVGLWLVAGVLAMVNLGLNAYVNWNLKHERVWQTPINVSFQPLTFVRDREPQTIISPLAQVKAVIEDTQYSQLSAVQKKLCDKFGLYECKTAMIVQSCENGTQDPERTNTNTDGSIDVGIMQINQQNWNKNGCGGLHDLTEVDRNIECAYVIWDRADGKQGDGKGSWTPWSSLKTTCFASRQ